MRGKEKKMKTIIESISIKRMIDEHPDLSWIGEFSDTPKDGAINHKERSGERHVYQYFNPANPGYAEQEYKEMMDYENGNYCFIGVQAEAVVSYPTGNNSRRLEWFTSGGLWGIHSDSDDDYLETIVTEELNDLKQHLEKFCVDVSNFDNIGVERKEIY